MEKSWYKPKSGRMLEGPMWDQLPVDLARILA